jgi:hypothetical protein
VTVLEDLTPPPKVEVWLAAIAAFEGLPYATILPGHGQPGDRGCTATRAPTSPPHAPPSPRPTASTGT